MTDNAIQQRRGTMPMAGPPPAVRPQETMPGPDDAAEGEFAKMANAAGIDIAAEMDRGHDPQQVLQAAVDAIWERMPTDDAGAAIEMMAKKYQLTPPWAKQQQQHQAPPQGAPAMRPPR